jgi:peptide deformylase
MNNRMSILKVTRLGHPVLRKIAAPVSLREIQSPAFQKLIDDMIETMKEYDGVGLAADQVHESKQIAVLEVAENPRYPDKPKVPLTVLINPKIFPLLFGFTSVCTSVWGQVFTFAVSSTPATIRLIVE